jgi:hypothetical protein
VLRSVGSFGDRDCPTDDDEDDVNDDDDNDDEEEVNSSSCSSSSSSSAGSASKLDRESVAWACLRFFHGLLRGRRQLSSLEEAKARACDDNHPAALVAAAAVVSATAPTSSTAYTSTPLAVPAWKEAMFVGFLSQLCALCVWKVQVRTIAFF